MGPKSQASKKSVVAKPKSGPKLQVLLVDDHPLWRETVRMVLEDSGGLTVIESESGEDALDRARTRAPDLIVMDVDLPGMSGIDATKQVRALSSTTKVLMLSSSDDKSNVLQAVRAGASGYMIKTARAEEILDAIQRIHRGELAFPASLSDLVLDQLRNAGGGPIRLSIHSDWVGGREGLTRLAERAGFEVVEASAKSLNEIIDSDYPTCLLIDLSSEAKLREIHELRKSRPGFPIVVLSDDLASDVALELVTEDARAIGYLFKGSVADAEDLADAVRRVVDGEAVIDSSLVTKMVEHKTARKNISGLTDREREVLELMAEGRSNQAICEKLFLSPKTVETRVANIFLKLGLQPAADDHRRVLAVLAYLRSKEK